MANEATLRVKTGLPIQLKCADGTGIEKGATVALTGDFTVSAAGTTVGLPAGGIVAGEKIASNGQTYASVYREGIFLVTLSGSGSKGDPITNSSVQNYFEKAATNEEDLWGTALEDWTTGQTKLVEIKPFGVSLA